jgi:CHASE2 domain-containing sensor protein
VIPWLRRDHDVPRPPLAGRLIGLAVGVLLLSFAASVALHVVQLLIPVVLPLVVLIGIYAVMFRRRHR